MPAAGFGLAEIALVLGFLIAWGILFVYRYSIGAALHGLASLLIGVAISIPHVATIRPLAFLGHAINSVDNTVRGTLGAAVTANERGIVALWNALVSLTDQVAGELEGLGADTLGALRRLEHKVSGVSRAWVRRFVAGVVATAVNAARRYLLRLIRAALAKLHSLEHRLSVAVANLEHWTGYTAKQLRAMLRRLNALKWLASYAGLAALGAAILRKLNLSWLRAHASAAALVAAGLATLGLSWIRCDRVGKGGRALCGLDGDLLDLLVLETALVVGAVSLREFTYDCQAIEGEAVNIMRAFIREF